MWAIRKGEWKLQGNPNDPSNKAPIDPIKDHLFLTNLDKDPSEMKNLAAEYPEKVQELVEEYKQWEFFTPNDLIIEK